LVVSSAFIKRDGRAEQENRIGSLVGQRSRGGNDPVLESLVRCECADKRGITWFRQRFGDEPDSRRIHREGLRWHGTARWQDQTEDRIAARTLLGCQRKTASSSEELAA
jgi:hypothetical protein